jgi:hypothetical protein
MDAPKVAIPLGGKLNKGTNLLGRQRKKPTSVTLELACFALYRPNKFGSLYNFRPSKMATFDTFMTIYNPFIFIR